MTATWGNPASSNFRKANIRQAKQGEARVEVHALIRPLVERLLAAFDDEGLDIQSATPGSEPNGTSFVLDPGEALERVEDAADNLGFAYRGKGRWQFVATPEWAHAKGEAFAAEEEREAAEPWAPKTIAKGRKPGSRELRGGEEGPDVTTVQLFIAADPTGVYDEQTQQAMVEYRAANRMPLHPYADADWWALVFPKRITWRRLGEGGREIRLAESALIAFGYGAGPVTGRYGVRMQRAMRAAREKAGIPGTAKLDRMVWGALFDLKWQGQYGVNTPDTPEA